MAHELRVATDEDYTGTLTLGFHPEGELHFEDGAATVDDEAVAENLDRRYTNIEYVGETGTADADAASADAVEPPIDPGDYTVDELEATLDEESFSDGELEALAAAEAAGENRETALETIDAAQ
jgi:hypothetical protein